jgi:hypothetical protein
VIRVTFTAAAGLILSMSACAHLAPSLSSNQPKYLSPEARIQAIRRAKVWSPTDIKAMDLRAGPRRSDAFEPNQTVTCTYRDKKLSGHSPKFLCAITADDEVKVKYGSDNGEVYGEVAATRFFWALGFPADAMYPVRVVCRGCPSDPDVSMRDRHEQVLFDPAAIERKLKGTSLEVREDSGWTWPELELVDESTDGASRAQRDALKLLAVMIQHTDTKAEQQRLLCPKQEGVDIGDVCAEPVLMVNDLGLTFGSANLFNRDSIGAVNFDHWSKEAVWADAEHCVGNLIVSQTGSLDKPLIREPGRRFLADLLVQLSDKQLHDLFDVARFSQRSTDRVHGVTTDQWVDAFKRKRSEIVESACPS